MKRNFLIISMCSFLIIWIFFLGFITGKNYGYKKGHFDGYIEGQDYVIDRWKKSLGIYKPIIKQKGESRGE